MQSSRWSGPPGYWPSPWPGEDAGPARRQAPHGVAGPGVGRGDSFTVVARHDLLGATMPILRDPGELYLLRNTLGPDTVAWVEQLDPETLATVARSPDLAGGPFWPGGLAAHADGSLITVYGRWAHRLEPDLTVMAARALPEDRPYNSFVVLDDGSVVTKDFAGDGPASTLLVLDPSTLEDRGPPVTMPEPSIGRLSADGQAVQGQGITTAFRYEWDAAAGRLDQVKDWSRPYRTRADQSYGWDAVLDGGHVVFMDNGEHTYERAMTLVGQGVAEGPVHLVRIPDAGGPPELTPISGLPHGTQTNLPAVDPGRGIVVGYDSGNGVLSGFGLTEDALEPRWSRPLNAAMHMVRYPDTGELWVNDHRDGGDEIVLVDVETGEDRGRAATGSPVQSVVFPAVGHDGALYYCSFTTVARVTVDR